ncbi:uncharacterized protein N7518_009865 [Penicillium psychrosexuale]|uniref:uncharacterized protein n=1 Tax=Penicillium psychrosexuale TaxID=1002107 RepID=UPI00254563EE|nr:uncharacterized protein N7518_009865 [Penicillium psychrosexuale]KAJ5781382.1 hypothetical protein N7518_009865 [Penicillium psychrosexuale]
MSRLGDFDYLCGTEVTLEHSSPSPSATFVLDDILSEEFQIMTQEEFDDDLGHPFTALKFSCHNLLDPTQQGFIRFYYQIPIDGTIYHSPQALTQHTHAEVKVLTSLYHKNCTAVPKLLGYGNRVQGVRDYVPGGYINYIAWTRVAGEPINSVAYWKRDLAYREEVRSVFRATYRHISGFRDPDTLDPTPLSDVTYAIWRLVRPARRVNWMRDSSDW